MSRDRAWYESWNDLPDRDPQLRAEATVMLLRDGPDGIEVLMVRHPRSDRFVSGVWAFPGGQVEDGDVAGANRYGPGVARRAAARETLEEVGLRVDPDALEAWSLWIPPATAPKRYSTWFFAGAAPGGEIVPDPAEIADHAWTTAADMFSRRDAGELRILPPTYLSLLDLWSHDTVGAALSAAARREPPLYRTNLVMVPDGAVALWEGDAGWASGEIDTTGPRHRLSMRDEAWRFDVSFPS